MTRGMTRLTPNALLVRLFVVTTLGGASAAAQGPGTVPPMGTDADPLTCWWRTSTAAVIMGERFTVTLTCATQETERDRVAVDPIQFDATALALAPFEVLSGRRHDDVVVRPLRHFQYEYVVRIVGSAAFGQDIDIPALSIKYRRQSSIGDTEGREFTYVLPALPVRVLSLLPAKAADIRDWTHEAFRELEARRRRARLELIAAAVAFAFAVVLLALALARMVVRYRARRPLGARRLSPSAIMGGGVRDLRRLAAEVAREGWTPDRAARALASLRVAAAVATGRAVAQSPIDATTQIREGQIGLRAGLFRQRQTVMSAAASAAWVDRRLAASPTGPVARRVTGALAAIRDSLRTFTRARYGPPGDLDAAALDAAFEAGVKAARRLRLVTWIVRPASALGADATRAARTGPTTWTR